jgi:hypothetical protein
MALREVLNIVMVNLIVFFALISLHEVGHMAAGMLFGCRYGGTVLMDSNFNGPYTEMYCSNVNYLLVLASSLAVTSLFSFMFLLLKSPTRNLFPISLGLSLIFSSADIILATGIQSLFYPSIALGFLITSAGEYSIAASYLKGSLPLDLLELEKEALE